MMPIATEVAPTIAPKIRVIHGRAMRANVTPAIADTLAMPIVDATPNTTTNPILVVVVGIPAMANAVIAPLPAMP